MDGEWMKRRIILICVLVCCVLQTPVLEPAAQTPHIIVFDLSHGQYSSFVHDYDDADLAANLTEMGYTVVWAFGGINTTVLTGATGLILGCQNGDNGFTPAEIADIGTWFNAGNKFLWVGGDSDYDGHTMTNNMSAVLEEVGSHVYHEQLSISDSYSNCDASYRVVANTTKAYTGLDVTAGVSGVLMHGPTCLYGSSTGDGANPVSLETGSITNVYPVLFYGASATVGDGDLVPPTSIHPDEAVGSFAAMTVEVSAGSATTGVIVVSGASPYGDYIPMYASEYYGHDLQGNVLVKNSIAWGMNVAIIGAFTTSTSTSTDTSTATIPELLGLLSMIITIGSLGVIVVISVLICRSRQ